MLIGSKDLTAPVRDIDAKVEVIITSTDARIGEGAIRFDNCAPGLELDVKLSSPTVSDFTAIGTRPSRNLLDSKSGISYIKFNTANGERARYGWVMELEPGNYYAHAESVNYTGGYIYLYALDVATNSVVSEAKYLANGGSLNPATGAITLAEGQRLLLLDYTSSHTQEQAEKFLYEEVNIQVETGSLPTAYEPFGTVQVGAEVKQYGKNLFDYKTYPLINYYWNYTTGKITTSNSYSCSMLMPCKYLQGKTITLNEAVYDVATGGSGGIVFYTGNTTDGFIAGAGGNKHTYTVPMEAEFFGITVPRAFASGEAIQIEIGDTETAFEAFKEPSVAKSDANGVVSGLLTYGTNTLILGETFGHDITITASYSIVSAGETYRCMDRLKSLKIDRVGESKFFGFGVCQKANIKLIDTQRNTNFSTNDRFKIYFDGIAVSPNLRVSEVHRDEKTGELSITTYDAINTAVAHTVSELGLGSYTIGEFADAIAAYLRIGIVRPELPEWDLFYEDGANFNDSDTLREALDDVAEATQTMYYISANDELVFKRLDKDGAADYTIDKNQYFTLDTKTNRRLTTIIGTNELNDALEPTKATTGLVGTTQIVRANAFWDLREDKATLVDNALAAMGDMTINQFDCDWRGNYLVEPGDKLELITKDDQTVFSYLINDTISYDGSFSQVSLWEYTDEEAEYTNATNLGEILKETYAKVDKINQEISMVVNSTGETIDAINGELEQINKKVSATVNKDEVEIMISNTIGQGVGKVETATGFTFNEDGLTVSASDSDISTTITEDGMTIEKGSKEVLTASNEGVKAIDLHATTYLIIGKYSRFENYPGKQRTACYWIG